MSKTDISWSDYSWNPLVGCSRISAGCKNCYAESAAKSARLQQFPQYQKVGDWNGTIEFVESQLLKPLSWKSPKKVFVCSMSDIFHANVKDEWLDKIFAVMAIASQHTFQVLTKRPERMREYFSDRNRARWICDRALDILRDEENPTQWRFKIHGDQLNVKIPLDNVWLGTSVENQKAADDRILLLRQTPASVRFLSCEPLLESIDIRDYLHGISWTIIGGESGTGARPCETNWIKSIVQQCQSANVAVFVKQLGSNPVNAAYLKYKTSDRKGGNIDDFPPELRFQEFPQ